MGTREHGTLGMKNCTVAANNIEDWESTVRSNLCSAKGLLFSEKLRKTFNVPVSIICV